MRINCNSCLLLSLQGSCQFIKCSNGKSCIEDQNSLPQCITCPRCSNGNKNLTHQAISKMVCGADGITYRSLCELRQKSCKLGKTISMLHRGPCTGSFSLRSFYDPIKATLKRSLKQLTERLKAKTKADITANPFRALVQQSF